MSGEVHIHAPPTTSEHRKYYRCPRCKTKRLGTLKCYEWYSPLWVCGKCKRTVVFE